MSLFKFITIFAFLVNLCQCTVIIDSGNPRFIRGSFFDGNQPKFQETSISIQQTEDQTILRENPGFAQSQAESMMSELNAYTQAITQAIVIEAQEINPISCVTTCQFSRAKLNSIKMTNDLQALTVQLDVLEQVAADDNHITRVENLVSDAMPGLAAAFSQMKQDLVHYNENKHGSRVMKHFTQAESDFNKLNMSLGTKRSKTL